MSSNRRRAIRPNNRVQVGANNTGRVRKCGKKRQGGAWVRTYLVTLDASDAVRTVRSDLIRPAAA